ncbi:MAG: YfcE family phosphodiesterase [bacterium]|nr:YfcE family phosphodiesterase [bacterium]
MKIAAFSDIHGNLDAFDKVVQHLKEEKCDTHLFLGDVCGYYYSQNEIIAMLKELPNLEAVAGNHDRYFLEALKDDLMMEYYTESFGQSFEHFKETITPASQAFLEALPERIQLSEYAIAGYHGSPWRPFREYVYPDSPMERFEELPYAVVFLGHTHYSMDIQGPTVRIINPGSVGQPRDGKRPTYAVYETETRKLEIKEVDYDPKPLLEEIKKRKETNAYLADILMRPK